jgi:hypothetical protein
MIVNQFPFEFEWRGCLEKECYNLKYIKDWWKGSQYQ